MTELKILSYNTPGLGGIKKQIDVFQYIKNKNFDICCLQDTHFTGRKEIYIRNRWDGNCYFSPAAQANARGVAIFFAKMWIIKYTLLSKILKEITLSWT